MQHPQILALFSFMLLTMFDIDFLPISDIVPTLFLIQI